MSSKTFQGTDIRDMSQRYRANFINSLTGFKSVNLVGTINAKAQTNLAVFSQIIHVGANPPLSGILFRPDTVVRHTLANILETGYFTLNHIQSSFYKQAHQTSAKYPEEQSEFDVCELTPQYSTTHPAPYVEESMVKMGLKFAQRVDLEMNGTILIIGEIIEVIAPANCVSEDGYVDIEKAGTLTSSALDGYHSTRLISRLPYARPNK